MRKQSKDIRAIISSFAVSSALRTVVIRASMSLAGYASLISFGTANIFAPDNLYDRLFGSNELVSSFLANATLGGSALSTGDNLAPLATKNWLGINANGNSTTNLYWNGFGAVSHQKALKGHEN